MGKTGRDDVKDSDMVREIIRVYQGSHRSRHIYGISKVPERWRILTDRIVCNRFKVK